VRSCKSNHANAATHQFGGKDVLLRTLREYGSARDSGFAVIANSSRHGSGPTREPITMRVHQQVCSRANVPSDVNQRIGVT
jgi:hypothetical protein